MLDYTVEGQWIIREPSFDLDTLGKVETLLGLGNGYVGLRTVTEEQYLGETRDMLVAGTFDRYSEEEVTEIPNAPDVTHIEMELNSERFELTHGSIQSYERTLNLKTGMLVRTVDWTSPKGASYQLKFERFVSLKRLHTICARISVTPKQDTSIVVTSGIDGRMCNDGSQHFVEGQSRFFDRKYLQYTTRTLESNLTFVVDAKHRFYIDGEEFEPNTDINNLRRRMSANYPADLKAGQTLVIEKYSNVYNSRDREVENLDTDALKAYAMDHLKEDEAAGFDALAKESADCWAEKVWDRVPIEIDGPKFDQLAIRFAQYHLQMMTPAHDNRMNIGGKGFTGEGYKGHTFWDTEIFILPYFIFNMPEVAKSLEGYRYNSLPGAHKKAAKNGYEGAQYPWESAWLDDGEVTPEYLGTNAETGELIKVSTGDIEIHITSDVALGIWQYYEITQDQEFMDQYGYEVILDCAKFWGSRLEDGDDGMLHINDVIGPDEYKEHVNDNAFTNYLCSWNIGKAIEYTEYLRSEKPDLYKKLDEKLDLEKCYKEWVEKKPKIYLTQPNEQNILPQDSTYLTLKEIDLTKYKNQKSAGSIMKDYNFEDMKKIQVSKQADVMVLFYLLEEQFPYEVKVASYNYYEPHCLHDSSLSLSTHSLLASDIGNKKLGYEMFQKACMIDLDNNKPHSSDEGIHAASIGGLWECVCYGFGGLRMIDGNLRISPMLPDEWNKLSYTLLWHGQRLKVTAKQDSMEIVNETGKEPVSVEVWNNQYEFTDKLEVSK